MHLQKWSKLKTEKNTLERLRNPPTVGESVKRGDWQLKNDLIALLKEKEMDSQEGNIILENQSSLASRMICSTFFHICESYRNCLCTVRTL